MYSQVFCCLKSLQLNKRDRRRLNDKTRLKKVGGCSRSSRFCVHYVWYITTLISKTVPVSHKLDRCVFGNHRSRHVVACIRIYPIFFFVRIDTFLELFTQHTWIVHHPTGTSCSFCPKQLMCWSMNVFLHYKYVKVLVILSEVMATGNPLIIVKEVVKHVLHQWQSRATLPATFHALCEVPMLLGCGVIYGMQSEVDIKIIHVVGKSHISFQQRETFACRYTGLLQVKLCCVPLASEYYTVWVNQWVCFIHYMRPSSLFFVSTAVEGSLHFFSTLLFVHCILCQFACQSFASNINGLRAEHLNGKQYDLVVVWAATDLVQTLYSTTRSLMLRIFSFRYCKRHWIRHSISFC